MSTKWNACVQYYMYIQDIKIPGMEEYTNSYIR